MCISHLQRQHAISIALARIYTVVIAIATYYLYSKPEQHCYPSLYPSVCLFHPIPPNHYVLVLWLLYCSMVHWVVHPRYSWYTASLRHFIQSCYDRYTTTFATVTSRLVHWSFAAGCHSPYSRSRSRSRPGFSSALTLLKRLFIAKPNPYYVTSHN